MHTKSNRLRKVNEPHTMSKKAPVAKRYIPLLLLGLVLVAAWASGMLDWFTLQNMQAIRSDVQKIYLDSPLLTAGGFSLIYATTVALSLPVATPLSLLGGAVFGTGLGTALVAISATLGATVLFLLARSTVGDVLRHRAHRFYDHASKEMNDNTVSYLLFLRLVPVFPFFIVNILPALFAVSLKAFFFTTFFGILPGTFVYVNVGSALGEVTSPSGLVGRQTLLAFTLLGILALVPVFIKKTRAWRG
jgi:uncharacterized membrane protein YdjX (TVP38/TMEM64 family)